MIWNFLAQLVELFDTLRSDSSFSPLKLRYHSLDQHNDRAYASAPTAPGTATRL